MAKKIEKKPAKNTQKIDPKMWACGEWLETFLNEDLRQKHFRELAEKALKILRIEYEITDDDPIFHHIRLIDEKTPENEDIFKNWDEIIYATPIVEMHETLGGMIQIGEKWSTVFMTPAVSIDLLQLRRDREELKTVFRVIKDSEKPWNETIAEIFPEDEMPSDYRFLGYWAHDYGGLTTTLVKSKGKLTKVNKFASIPRDLRLMFLWGPVISRIFFDFLALGGQEYYSFCERCGKFTVVQRKGRKKYCSELCRVYAHQEKEEAEKAAKKAKNLPA